MENSTILPLYRRHFPRRLTAAAILILLAGAAVYSWRQYPVASKKQIAITPLPAKNDAPPGHNGAILTLSDQQQVVLDSLHDGAVIAQGQTTVSIKNGQLTYAAREIKGICGAEFGPLFNTLTTPKGRQYQFTLPDGTRVWLNAASSITYPTEFCGKDRTVTITGEACLEIAKDPSRPFNIRTNTMDVEVLGASVDVNAYSDEGVIKTTPLEGGVRVKNAANAIVLRPGQQASLDASTAAARFKVKDHVNLEEVMAWKNGWHR
jgi:ferric-dicitrate binding protein FerR (iron transport regulator)